ncbi:hypothetical protein FSP39_013948 [Pinctada imbricata]|uniref:SWIM-type domain-containing protein n=1 Tax=Pinctada imbricata TaxID=66713 RepID=A0AA88YV69_PINIB|nr:hypothetical protein FSP39_013948 [Pinctada imbricata]
MQNISQKGHYFVKSTVLASYSQRSYSSTVTISENSGMIRDATCTCSAAGLGRCAHVAAILFALEDFISEFGTDVPTCTEKLCAWNKGRRKNKNPAAVYSKQYPSMKKELKKIRTPGIEILKSDPRPEALRQDKISKEDKNAFVSDLNNLGGECGWTTLLDFVYDDFTVEDYGTEILKTQCEQFHFNLKEVCTDKQGPFQLDKTVGQSDSKEWMLQRKCRVTASVAKDVACIKTGHTGVLKRILYTDSPLTPAIIYGQKNEKKALESYIEKNPQYTIDSTGLWINPKYPGLGCSPDGIFNDTQSTTGLIEIKCPYVLKNVSPCMAQKSMTMKEEKNFFCTFQSDGTLRLKRNHKYYYQIQMQLAICEQKVCDFVIWSQHGMSVERIQMDESFWNHTYPKLLRFHKEYLVPEYFLMRIPRELESAKFEY